MINGQLDMFGQPITQAATTAPCPTCNGAGSLSADALEAMMARQPHTRSRAASTATSADAARMLDPDTCRANHRLILGALTANGDGLTDEQISFVVNSRVTQNVSASTLRARRSELMHAGMVTDSGRRRAKTDTGRPSAVWAITQLGRLAVVSNETNAA